jgi:hypothetical protein
VKYWEIIADNLSKAGWSWGWVSAIDSEGRTIWIVDAHRGGKRFIVRADEMLTAFVELERAIYEFAADLIALVLGRLDHVALMLLVMRFRRFHRGRAKGWLRNRASVVSDSHHSESLCNEGRSDASENG